MRGSILILSLNSCAVIIPRVLLDYDPTCYNYQSPLVCSSVRPPEAEMKHYSTCETSASRGRALLQARGLYMAKATKN